MADSNPAQELRRLRAELELLKAERQRLLRAAGAAAVFVVGLDAQDMSEPTYKMADLLADALNAPTEETLRTAIDLVWRETGQTAKRSDGTPG